MSRTYAQLPDLVRMWANRDPDVLPDPIVYDFIRYAADKTYRSLRVPALEISRIFEVTEADYETDPANSGVTTVNIPVPQDLIDVIYIRNKSDGYVFEEKVDLRTFYDNFSQKTTRTFWTRDGNTFKVSGVRLGARVEAADAVGTEGEEGYVPAVEEAEGTMLEIHYYRRLPALDATYIVSAASYNVESSVFMENLETEQNDVESFPNLTDPAVDDTADDYLWFAAADTSFATAFDSAQTITDIGRHYTSPTDMEITAAIHNDADVSDLMYAPTVTTVVVDSDGNRIAVTVGQEQDDTLWFNPSDLDVASDSAVAVGDFGRRYIGTEVNHWLRDENERIVLFGALAEAFAYLAEDDQAAKYLQIWQTEIDELNREETMRQTKGGTIKINYDGFGMI